MEEKKTRQPKISPELVRKARGGDRSAVSDLYEQSSTELYRTICSMVRDEDLAWDILQDTYLRAFKSLSELRSDDAFLPWLRRIAVNVTSTEMMKRHTVFLTELNETLMDPVDVSVFGDRNQPELAMDRKETSRLVREILEGLPEGQHLVIGMFYYEDMSVKEISETLHISAGTVKRQLHEGRKKVEKRVLELESRGVKLYSLSPVSFLMALLHRLEPDPDRKRGVPPVIPPAPIKGAATLLAVSAGTAFLHSLGGKLLAVLLTAAVVGGGYLACDRLLRRSARPDAGVFRPTAETREKGERNTEDEDQLSVRKDPTEEADGEENAPVNVPDAPAYVPDEPPSVPDASGTQEQDPTEPEPPEDTGPETPPEEPPETEPDDRDEQDDGTALVGTQSNGIRWKMSGDGSVLSFAATEDYVPGSAVTISTSVPWMEDSYKYHVFERVEIGEGIESVLDIAPGQDLNAKVVVIPASMRVIRAALPGRTGEEQGLTATDCYEVAPGNPSYSSDGQGILYNADKTVLLHCPNNHDGNPVIPPTVTVIGEAAFRGCTLTEVTIPEGVVSIGSAAFSSCYNLKSVLLPDSVSDVGASAFSGCIGLKTIQLPGCLRSLPDHMFSNSGIETISIPEGVEEIGNSAFSYCENLVSVTLPDTLVHIRVYSFHNCPRLTSIEIPANVTGIGFQALGYYYENGKRVRMEDFTVIGQAGSAAQTWAESEGFEFIAR